MALEDNVAVEFNIPPAKTVDEFVESIEWSMKKLADEVKIYGCKPSEVASALFSPTELMDARSMVFGCDPDFNAWKGGRRNPRPHATNERLRTCGGHVHVGYPMDTKVSKLRLIQLMDLYLGVPSIMMDTDVGRRELYGKAGAYRTQPWGVEYRTLSNFWLKDKKYCKWVYEQASRAFDTALKFGHPAEDGSPDDYSRFMEQHDLAEEIQATINCSELNLAQKLIVHHDLVVV
jgi:hypothetical protein